MTADREWRDALRIARVMARQNERMEALLPKPRKAKAKREQVKRAEPENPPTPAKIIPFVSRKRWNRHISAIVKDFVYGRDGGRCFYCHCDVARFGAHFDHVLPVARGGQSTYANLVLSCARCNSSKSASVLENLDEILLEVNRRNREAFG